MMDKKQISLRNRLFFQSTAASFPKEASLVRKLLEYEKDAYMTAEIAMDLSSYMVHYISGYTSECEAAAHKEAEKFLVLLRKWGETELLKTAEEEIKSLKTSSLIKLTELGDTKELAVRWGNDNGLGIMKAMRRGAMFVTTNPPIVNMARKEKADVYDKIRNRICADYKDEPVENRISRLTMEVVLNNCRALYAVFERSGHRAGYVHYQVNPCSYRDSKAMTQEILFAYSHIQKKLGGRPNVLFKIPGTKAALETAEEVSRLGIGVTITVNFSAAQSYAFAKRIQEGCAERSFVVMMAGRLDGPVEEELEKAGVSDAAVTARGASRAVTYQIYHNVLLKNRLDKTNILVASLRGAWNFEASLTKDRESEIVISSFPDKWADYDAQEQCYQPMVQEKPPEELISRLKKSETFKKAYELEGMSEEEFDTYGPVTATLKSFIQTYEELKEYMSA